MRIIRTSCSAALLCTVRACCSYPTSQVLLLRKKEVFLPPSCQVRRKKITYSTASVSLHYTFLGVCATAYCLHYPSDAQIGQTDKETQAKVAALGRSVQELVINHIRPFSPKQDKFSRYKRCMENTKAIRRV